MGGFTGVGGLTGGAGGGVLTGGAGVGGLYNGVEGVTTGGAGVGDLTSGGAGVDAGTTDLEKTAFSLKSSFMYEAFAVTKTKATTIRQTALKAIVRTRGEAATKK